MEIFWRLLLGHLISDFTLQTNYVASWKRRSIWGLLVHCLTHPVIYGILTWNYLNQVWIQIGPMKLTGCLCILIIFITHLVEDEWRIWSVLKKGAPDNTFFYAWDQVIHYAILFAMAPVIEGSTGKFGFAIYPPLSNVISAGESQGLTLWEKFATVIQPESWVFIAILFVIVTHFTTVTIYFIEKDLFGRDYPDADEKYISMAERVVVMGCFLLPGLWWISVLGVWLLRPALYKMRGVYDFSWINILVGNGTAILCGIISRSLIY